MDRPEEGFPSDGRENSAGYERQCRKLAELLDEAQEELDRNGPVPAEELGQSLAELFKELERERSAG